MSFSLESCPTASKSCAAKAPAVQRIRGGVVFWILGYRTQSVWFTDGLRGAKVLDFFLILDYHAKSKKLCFICPDSSFLCPKAGGLCGGR